MTGRIFDRAPSARTVQPAASATPAPLRHVRPTLAAVIQRARLDPRTLTRDDAVQLQRSIGNAAVGRLLTPSAPSNPTGLPDGLKANIEALSGLSLDDVRVHRGSPKPAEVQAHAYAQGVEIHLGPGQERHLPHEAWHVVQQKQGRVEPTAMAGDTKINASPGLEREADVMGGRAMLTGPRGLDVSATRPASMPAVAPAVMQYVRFGPPGGPLGADQDLNTFSPATLFALRRAFGAGGVAFAGVVLTPNGPKQVSATAPEVADVIGKVDRYIADSPVPGLARKISENPFTQSYMGEVDLSARLTSQSLRKVNRISGLIARKHHSNPHAAGVIDILNDAIVGTMPTAAQLVAHMSGHFATPTLQIHEFDRLVLSALHQLFPALSLAIYESRLELHWRQLEGANEKVIAHRGDGATFDRMNSILPRHQHNFAYIHENENSFESTRKFVGAWSQHNSALSGIECDVFLSQDDVPIVSHTDHAGPLLDQENPTLPPSGVGSITGNVVQALPPRFMRLADWLTQLSLGVDRVVADEQLNGLQPRRRLRVEIEMKDPRFNATAYWAPVQKVVSRFLKAYANSHRIEVAMFNNSPAPRQIHTSAAPKTMLSHVTYGQGGTAMNIGPLREVRYGGHQKQRILADIDAGNLDGKIVTFAPGLDYPGLPGATQPQLWPVARVPTMMDVTIEQSLQSARRNALIARLYARRSVPGLGPVSVHTLTDHGEAGARAIIARGLTVGSAMPVAWDAGAIMAMHPEIPGASKGAFETWMQQLFAQAAANNDFGLIGRTMLAHIPGLL